MPPLSPCNPPPSGVQAYQINGHPVIFIRPRPAPPGGHGVASGRQSSQAKCLVDGRGLMQGNATYCCLRCVCHTPVFLLEGSRVRENYVWWLQLAGKLLPCCPACHHTPTTHTTHTQLQVRA